MRILKVTASRTGEDVFIFADKIISYKRIEQYNATVIEVIQGRSIWVKETPEDITQSFHSSIG